MDPKRYYCPFIGTFISGVAARGCNYSNLEDFTCNHTGQACVAKEGMLAFAQSSAKEKSPKDQRPLSQVDGRFVDLILP